MFSAGHVWSHNDLFLILYLLMLSCHVLCNRRPSNATMYEAATPVGLDLAETGLMGENSMDTVDMLAEMSQPGVQDHLRSLPLHVCDDPMCRGSHILCAPHAITLSFPGASSTDPARRAWAAHHELLQWQDAVTSLEAHRSSRFPHACA